MQPLTYKPIALGADVWIGAGCKILNGVRIGEGSVIGAGSVVTKDIDPYSVAFGLPAKVVRSRQGR
jgi:acetyltransferase-like isoleucine patch superfamily enzyme